MKKLFLFFTLCVGLFLGSCSKSSDNVTPANPIPNFTIANENNLRAPVEVKFTNTSIDADSYEWTFGTSKSSDKDYSEVIYNGGGVFSVTLKATKGGVSKTLTKTFNVLPAYTKVRIKDVRITSMPFTDSNGSSWDIAGGSPDVYYEIQSPNPNNTPISNGNVTNNVTASMLPISWTYTNFFLIPTNNETYFVQVKDQDTPPTDPDDNIEYVGFRMDGYMQPYAIQKYPAQITLTRNNLTIILGLQWEL